MGLPLCSDSFKDLQSIVGYAFTAIFYKIEIQPALSHIGFFDFRKENSFPPG
jgi:hypothetical protein